MAGQRYAGLMSYFVQAVSNLKLINNTEHKIYFKYDHNMLYLDPIMKGNVWEYYFDQPFTFTEDEIKSSKVEKDVWFPDCLNIPTYPDNAINLAAFELIEKYIKLKPHLSSKIDAFLSEHASPSDKIISIHKRGTDHVNDSPEVPIETYFNAVDISVDEYQKILVCSDEEYSIDAFKKRYGNNKVISYNSMRALKKTTLGIHQSIGLQSPYKMGEDVIIETFLMAKTHKLIKTVSNVSNSVLLINPKLQYLQLD